VHIAGVILTRHPVLVPDGRLEAGTTEDHDARTGLKGSSVDRKGGVAVDLLLPVRPPYLLPSSLFLVAWSLAALCTRDCRAQMFWDFSPAHLAGQLHEFGRGGGVSRGVRREAW
jgi:hypothetical protein